MNRFNLTFSGEILSGHDPAAVKRNFGKMFAIEDPVRLENFFSGQTIILRRNLERKDAAEYFHQLNLLGAVASLVKVNDDGTEATDHPAPNESPVAANGEEKAAITNIAELDPNSQIWPVSSHAANKTIKKRSNGAARVSTDEDLTARIKARIEETRRQAEEEAQAERMAQPEKTGVGAKEQQETEKKRREAEETRRLKSERKEKKRRKAEEAARLKAELKEKERREAELEEKKRREAEEAAHRKAELEEEKRREAEAAARHKAELEEKKRREAEAAARHKAELEEKKRREAEAAARRKAEREEEKRREAEAAARRKAEREEEKRREAEAAARRKAEREAEKRREAAARRKAEREEEKRREAEAAAWRKAEIEEKKRREAEEAARREAELEEKKRRETEEAARREAELEEKKRRETEEAARREAEREEKQRREAEREEKQRSEAEEEIKRLEAKEATWLQAELETIKRQEEADIFRIQSESRDRQLEAEQGSAARLRDARSQLLLDTPADTAQPQHEPTESDSGAHLRTPRDHEVSLPPARNRKRQPGEPNLYALRPFRNSQEIRARCDQSRMLKRRGYLVGIIGLVLVLLTAERFFRPTTERVTAGISAVTTDASSGPVLLTVNSLLMHDRAGVATGEVTLQQLGLHSLSAPLAFDQDGSLVASGIRAGTAQTPDSDVRELLRCDLETSACKPLSEQQNIRADAIVINDMDGSVITASAGRLKKISADGEVSATAEVALPKQPVLRLHAGLLFVNSAAGPGISVYRYENTAFGKQLDEILLLPPEAVDEGQSRVGDFIWSGGAWWASLYNPQSGGVGLYRFDEDWNSLGRVELQVASLPVQLASWGEKLLVNDLRSNTMQRFSAQGQAEVPFISTRLEEVFDHRKQRARLERITWRGGLLAGLLIAFFGLGFGILQSLRQRVYKPRRERGAEPVDEHSHLIQWIEPFANRPALMRYRSLCYGLLIIALAILAVAASVSVWQLAALLMVLTGPAIALLLITRQPIGHIGRLDDRLLLVDHSGMYHLARGSSVQHKGPYLLIDDVVVFIGNTLFPAFKLTEVRELLQPLTASGVKVDHKTVLIKLLQGHHPLALGGCAILLCTAAAAILLCLQGIL